MKKPKVINCFADNGEHSHWALINEEDGELLWDESDDSKDNQVTTELHGLEEVVGKICGDTSPSPVKTVIRARVLLENSSWNKRLNPNG